KNDENGSPVSVEDMLAKLAQDANDPDAFPMFDANDMNPSFTANGRFYDGTTITFDSNTGKFAGIGGSITQTTITAGFSAMGGNFSDIEIDFSECSMFDNKETSTIGATSGDADGLGAGRRLGDMIGVSIQNNGMIYASYDNGMTKLLGQIATAEFANVSGLEKKGDNLYSATMNSGDFDGIGTDLTSNGGYMSTGQLEMSNVDLSSEFTEMITTQRGFQANSRIITVSDTLLEELTNLKR
ncbi:MAG: flagellar hook-basal body complex protein, partial [Lachnospiraceae bacterium]|nr:flagellar hook-basal body complex protein [Lachnospiraceae bacterium]